MGQAMSPAALATYRPFSRRRSVVDDDNLAAAQSEHTKALEKAQAADMRAQFYRNLCDGFQHRLRALMEARHLPAMFIEGDELMAPNPDTGEIQTFESLSAGQKVRLVLCDIVAKHVESRCVPLSPSFWFDLQPAIQKELADLAVAADLYIVTEEATDDAEVGVRHEGEEVASGS